MKGLVKRLAQLAALVALGATATLAQSSGTVTINGNVGKAVSIRFWSFSAIGGATGGNSPAGQNQPLSFTLDLGDVSPNNANDYVGGRVTVILRSNTNYKLSAQVTSSSGFGSAANGDITLADIGFGLQNLQNSGGLVVGNPAANSTIAAPFNNDPSSATKDQDGIPQYSARLSNITTQTDVLTGPRISKGGSINSPNNGLLVDTIYVVAPQFFTPTTGNFSATVTYTITAP